MKKLLFLFLLVCNIGVSQVWDFSRIQQNGTSLSTSTSTITGFSATLGNASASQSFTVSGVSLTTDVTLTVSGSYEISTNGGSTWGTSRTLTVGAGIITGQPFTVQARITSAATAGAQSGSISLTTTGASASVSLNGNVETPTINVSPTSLVGFANVTGTASSAQTFTIDADNLTADVTVTAPTDFEVSLSSGSGYANSLTLGRTGNNLTGEPVTIYTRIKASATTGSKSGNVASTSTNATTKNVAVSGDVSPSGVARRILIDLGGDGSTNNSGVVTTNPQGSLYWNNIIDGTVATLISDPIDVDNTTVTGFSIASDKKPGGGYAPEDKSNNNGGYTTAVSDYHVNAVRDNMYVHSSAGVVTLTFVIPSGKQASIKFWGGRNATGPRILQIKRSTDGSYTQEYEAASNQTYSNGVTFTGISGTTSFNLQVKSGLTFGHISVIDITLTDL